MTRHGINSGEVRVKLFTTVRASMQLSNWIKYCRLQLRFSVWGFRFLASVFAFFFQENANLFNYSPRMSFTSQHRVWIVHQFRLMAWSLLMAKLSQHSYSPDEIWRKFWFVSLWNEFRPEWITADNIAKHRLGEQVASRATLLASFSIRLAIFPIRHFPRFARWPPTPLVTLFCAKPVRASAKCK